MIQGEVLKKYAPSYGKDAFFCQLLDDGLGTIKAMVHESHYAKFDVGDTIEVAAFSRGDWLRVREATGLTVIRLATPEIKYLKVKLDYVSDPKLIGEDFWYLAKVLDDWFRIPYTVASKYWLGDRGASQEAFQVSYYELLEVAETADSREIHRAWRRVARKYHPDLFPVEERVSQGEIMARVNAAHDCLMDAGERGRYDAQLIAPSRDQKVKAWPGRGFGTLHCWAEVRGDAYLVIKIISWANQEFDFAGSLAMAELHWSPKGLWLTVDVGGSVGVYQATEPLLVPWEHLPMNDSSEYGRLGHVRYRIQAIQSGRWDWKNKVVVRRLRVREATFEWPF